jgi:hypothetical protein
MEESLQAPNRKPFGHKNPRLLDLDLLRQFLEYDPTSSTGLRWVKTTTNRVKPGEKAGQLHSTGYFKVSLHGINYPNSRLVWALVTGEDPGSLHIDHIDKNKLNNQFENLRLVTHRRNMQNRSDQPTPGVGAYYHKQSGRWISMIGVGGKQVYLGIFGTPEKAAEAYQRALANLCQD